MGSKGRIPPHLRHPLPGPAMIHPDPFGPGIHPPPGAFHTFDMFPPPEVMMEQKLSAQHVEMQKLVTENQRLAATHTVLRQELGATQQEIQRLHAHIGAMKTEKEHQMRGLMEKIAKIEVDLQVGESVHMELQKARVDAQNLFTARQELFSKVQQLTQDLHRSHTDVQQIPSLMSELESLRQEYQHCRATYDYEKKLYNDHLESLQVMENNYISMARELEKLRAELANPASIDRRTGGPYGGTTAYSENEAAAHHAMGQNTYDDGYNIPQGHGSASAALTSPPLPPPPPPPHGGGQPVAAPRAGYDVTRGPGYDVPRGGPVYDAQRGSTYDAPSRGSGRPHEQVPPVNYASYASETAPARSGGGPQGQVAPLNYASYASETTPSHSGGGPQAQLPPVSYAPYASETMPARSGGGPQGQVPPVNYASYASETTPARSGGGPQGPVPPMNYPSYAPGGHSGGGYEASRGGNPVTK